MHTDISPPRHDLYAAPHKGLRNFMSDTQLRIGMLDTEDLASARDAIEQLRALLALMTHHLNIEERFVLPAIEVRRPGASADNAGDHHHHRRTMTSLGDRANAVERAVEAGSQDRHVLAHRLYLELSTFVGDNFTHMAIEETVINQILWALYDDEELRAIQGAILAWETPEQLAASVRWLVPALNPAERAFVFSGARSSLEPPVYDQLVGFARTLISQADWVKLATALDMH